MDNVVVHTAVGRHLGHHAAREGMAAADSSAATVRREASRIKKGNPRPACTEGPERGGGRQDLRNKKGAYPACLYQGPRNWIYMSYCTGRASFEKPGNMGVQGDLAEF